MIYSQYLNGLYVVKLYRVQGGLVERYNQALQKLIGKTTKLDKFHIDKRGVSPEIEQELGKFYLRNGIAHRYIIIVSPEQQNVDLIYDNFSFDEEIINQLFDNYISSISAITRVDSLYGELDDEIEQYRSIKDVIGLKRVSLELQTPSEFLPKAKSLLAGVQQLRENPELLVEDNAQLLKDMLELVEAVGDVRPYNIDDLKIIQDIESFYIKEMDVHVFRVQAVNLIKMHHPSKRKRRNRQLELNPITVVIHNEEKDPNDKKRVKYIKREIKKVLELLLSQNWIKYDESLIEARLSSIVLMTMAQQGIDVVDMDSVNRHRFVEENAEKLPEEWQWLCELQTKCLEGIAFEDLLDTMSWDKKLLLVDVVKDVAVPWKTVGHLLSCLAVDDWETALRYNPMQLQEAFKDAKLQVKNYLVEQMQKQVASDSERVDG